MTWTTRPMDAERAHRRAFRRIARGLLGLIPLSALLGALAACGGAAGPADVAPAPGAPAAPPEETAPQPDPEPIAVVIGTPSRSLSWFPAWVAKEKGFFAEEAITAEFPEIKSTAAVAAVAAGQMDYTTAFGSSVQAAASGVDVRVLMTIASAPQHVAVAGAGIDSIEALRGRRIAIDAVGSTTHREVQVLLEAKGMTEQDVQLLPLGASQNRVAALETGQVDATILAVPFNLPVEAKGFRRIAVMADYMEAPLSGIGPGLRSRRRGGAPCPRPAGRPARDRLHEGAQGGGASDPPGVLRPRDGGRGRVGLRFGGELLVLDRDPIR